MGRVMKWLAIVAAIAIAVVVIFKVNFPTYSYRYRLQIALAIDDKVYTGSSVIEVDWSCGPKIAGLGQCAPSLYGQAALIDLGARGVVVATLFTGEYIFPIPDGAVEAVWLCANAFDNKSTTEELPKLSRLSGRRGLSPSNFPRLVWFSDPANRESAKKITIQNVAAVLDSTARFTEAFVEITKDPIVVNIWSKLPWLSRLRDQQKGKLILSYPGQFQLTYRMFVGDS